MVQFLSINFFSWISSIFVGFLKSSHFFVSLCRKYSGENRMGYQVTNEIVSSTHEIVVCVKIHIRYDILICRKFLCLAIFGPGGAGLTSFYCNFTSSVLLIRNLLNGCPVFFFAPPLLLLLVPPPPTPLSLLVLSQCTLYSFHILIPQHHEEMCLESVLVSR